MPSVVDIAPGGDLIVSIGENDSIKFVRVSATLLNLASPVFSSMLTASVEDSQQKHDATNPLNLADDDSTSMINLFQILHWHNDGVSTSASDWLQKLAVVCHKYGCASKLQDFFVRRMLGKSLNTMDKLVIYSILNMETEFAVASELFVRMSKAHAQSHCHPDLLKLVPEGALDYLAEYREKARAEYALVAVQPTVDMYKAAADKELCFGLQERLVTYWQTLTDERVVVQDRAKDAQLPDMHAVMNEKLCVGKDSLDSLRCNKDGFACGCDWSGRDAMTKALEQLTRGKKGECQLCFECFKAGRCEFAQDCIKHLREKENELGTPDSERGIPQ